MTKTIENGGRKMSNLIWAVENIAGIISIIGAGIFVTQKLDKIACDIWDRIVEKRVNN